MTGLKLALFSIAALSLIHGLQSSEAAAADAGAEIKIGHIAPYSGPLSAYAVLGKTFTAYFKMINESGGIRGRRINFISYDDAYNPAKTVEQARKLVESDDVLALFYVTGTPGNTAIHKYLNSKKVPQLFAASGASKWGDPKRFPWTMGWIPNYRLEARIYGAFIRANYPNAKVGVLYQNDDFGKDYMAGLKEGLGSSAQIVSAVSYDTNMPTIDSQIVEIRSANPDVFVNAAATKFAAQAIKKIGELGWHPAQLLTEISASVGAVLRPAGFDNAKGIISANYMMDVTDPQWDDDPGMKKYRAFMAKYLPDVDIVDAYPFSAYAVAQALIKVLEQCGDDLSRENIMRQAANLDFQIDVYLPGVRVKTSPTDFYPIEQLQMMRFDGQRWVHFGDIVDGHVESAD